MRRTRAGNVSVQLGQRGRERERLRERDAPTDGVGENVCAIYCLSANLICDSSRGPTPEGIFTSH